MNDLKNDSKSQCADHHSDLPAKNLGGTSLPFNPVNLGMKRWEAEEPGIAALRMTDAPCPTPAAGEVIVRIAAVALNYRDLALLEGKMGEWSAPHIPGSDISGVVVSVGSGVTRFSVGDRVVNVDITNWIDGPAPDPTTNSVPLLGRLAAFAAIPADLLVAAPSEIDLIAASTLPVAGLTAWFAVVEMGRIQAGDVVVVQGTGGVAMFAIQFAIAHSARVIVVSSSSGKIERLKSLGPVDGIDRNRYPEWDTQVLALTGGRGADHVLEMGGGDISSSLNAIRVGGRISIIGVLGNQDFRAPTFPMLFKRALLIGIGVGHRRAQEDMIRAIDRLKLNPVLDSVYPFSEAPKAFAHLKAGAFGKVVVRMALDH